MSGSKRKSTGDVEGTTVRRSKAITTEMKVKITEIGLKKNDERHCWFLQTVQPLGQF